MNTATIQKIKISAEYIGDKKSSWSDENWHNNRVTVKSNGRQFSFDFWGSIINPECRSVSDLKHAVYCAVSDARSGDMEFNDFCAEFGYNTDSIKAHEAWKACRAMKKKVDRVLTVEQQDEILISFG